MKVQDIIDYVLHTPGNTNAEILREMIGEWTELKDYVKNLNIQQLEDYLYKATYTDWNYTVGKKYANKFWGNSGCSVVRNGDLIGRNYDWYFNKQVEFIVKSIGYQGRHTSLSVCPVPIDIQPKDIEEQKYIELFEVIPFMAVDGINDAGVFVESNVCPPGDKGYTIGTNPGKPEMNGIMVARYILDYANSARHAVELLMNNISITGLYGDNIAEELHWMICDSTGTYIVECIDNKINVLSNLEDEFDNIPNNKEIMTNFHLSGFDGEIITGFDTEEGINPEDTTLTRYAMGTERYQSILDRYDSLTDLDNMKDMMHSIWYTNAYNSEMNPYWYSEFVGVTKTFGDLTIYDPKSKFDGMVAYTQEMFKNRTREKGDTWHTVHSVVYELEEKKLHIIVQENGENIDIGFDDPEGDIIVYDGGNIDEEN